MPRGKSTRAIVSSECANTHELEAKVAATTNGSGDESEKGRTSGNARNSNPEAAKASAPPRIRDSWTD